MKALPPSSPQLELAICQSRTLTVLDHDARNEVVRALAEILLIAADAAAFTYARHSRRKTMRRPELPASVVERRAIVYVRQSSLIQVEENLESQRRQYELARAGEPCAAAPRA